MDFFGYKYLPNTGLAFIDRDGTTNEFCRVNNWSLERARPWIDLILDWTEGLDTSDWLEYQTLFNFVRFLKSKLTIENRRNETAQSLAPFAVLFVEALVHGEKLPLLEHRIDWYNDDAIMLAFEDAWAKARYAEGENLLDAARAWAETQNKKVVDLEPESFRLLIGMAQYLQCVNEEAPIQLPVHKLASRLGVTAQTVSHLITKGIRDGWLELVDGRYSQEGGRAKLYRFIPERLVAARKAKRAPRSSPQVQPI